MKTLTKNKIILFLASIILFACQPEEVKLNEFSYVFITWSPLVINVGGEVDLADGSHGVKNRLWTFPAEAGVDILNSNNDQTSTERIVYAVFNNPGVFGIRLQAEFADPSVKLDSIITVTVIENVKALLSSDAPILNGQHIVEAGMTVNYESISTGLPDSYQWTFEGAEPTEANGQKASVRYNYPGTWDVQLIAYRNKPRGRDTIYVRNYITVLPASTNGAESE
jgi:PKD repeat protein